MLTTSAAAAVAEDEAEAEAEDEAEGCSAALLVCLLHLILHFPHFSRSLVIFLLTSCLFNYQRNAET